MNVKLQISNVTNMRLEPTWSEGDYLENLDLTVVDSLNDEVRVRLIPIADKKIDLLFPDPPKGIDGLAGSGFVDVTNGEPGTLAFVRDEFIRKQVQQLEDFMREQADMLDTEEGLPFDFDEELGEVMDALRDEVAVQLHLALNQTRLDLGESDDEVFDRKLAALKQGLEDGKPLGEIDLDGEA